MVLRLLVSGAMTRNIQVLYFLKAWFELRFSGAYTAVSSYISWINDLKVNYDPCENEATQCSTVVTNSAGVLTPVKNKNGFYLNDQVTIY